MDLREKKTRRSITNAFLQLRSRKPLERITIKELAELAQISKATFYLHYRDIYDLSEALQNEVIQEVLGSIGRPEGCLTRADAFTGALCQAFYARQSLIATLFSGTQATVLPMRLERELRQRMAGLEIDAATDVRLTYSIYGAYCACQAHSGAYGQQALIRMLSEASRDLLASGKMPRGDAPGQLT